MNGAVDVNSRSTITAILNTDGLTIERIVADPSTHRMHVNDGSTGSNNGGSFAYTDDNDRPTLIAVSNADGVTLVGLYADSTGALLIKST